MKCRRSAATSKPAEHWSIPMPFSSRAIDGNWTVYTSDPQIDGPNLGTSPLAVELQPRFLDTAPIVYQFYDADFQNLNNLVFNLALFVYNESGYDFSNVIVDLVSIRNNGQGNAA